MLSAAKHLGTHRGRPFAALRVIRKGHPVQRRAGSARLLSRPRPVESWTRVFG